MRLRRIEPVLRRALDGACSVPSGSRVLVAVSGGADSTALLLGLRNLAKERALDLHAAHLHHGLRKEADGDAEAVRQLCEEKQVALTATRWNTRLRMERRGLSGQAGLRTLRREFLSATAKRIGAHAIATAHTADDQLETLLLRLMRGTGLSGLAGMRARDREWIKPLLEATRSDIEADLKRAGQRWCEDATNADLGYARNRVRHLAVPGLLKSLGLAEGEPLAVRHGRSTLARNAQRIASEAADAELALELWMDRTLSSAWRIQEGVIDLDSEQVGLYPIALKRTLLRTLWKRVEPAGPGLTRDHIGALVKLLSTRRSGAQIELPGGRLAVQDRGRIRIQPGRAHRARRHDGADAGENQRWRISRRWMAGETALSRLTDKPADVEFFAAEGLEGRLELRAAQADEEFVPFGRRRAVRLGTFLSRQRINVEEGASPTVLADAGGILWVVGVRRSARAPITADTRKALWVRAEHS